MSLTFERRGATWVAVESNWELMLIARNVYPGTERLLATITLAREVPMAPRVLILTDRLNLMTASHRDKFCKLSAERLRGLSKAKEEANATAISAMLDGLHEHLLVVGGQIESVDLGDIDVPENMTPPYTLWPMVPSSRPGMLVAPSGSGKSTLAGLIGLSVVTGKTILPRLEPHDQGPVLYIGQEESKEQWAARITQLCRGHEIKPPRHYQYMHLTNSSLVESAEVIAEKSATLKAVLVIVDSAQATWGAESESVRGWATQWFNAVDQLETPTLIIDHPNRAETGKPSENGFAAGSSVKRDRVGHSWSLKSEELVSAADHPLRYHVTLRDTKRNYVARQDDIYYETIIKGYDWIKVVETEKLSVEAIVERFLDQRGLLPRIVAVMHGTDSAERTREGWSHADLAEALDVDARQIRREVNVSDWRDAPWETGYEMLFQKVEGTGRTGVPARIVLVSRPKITQMRLVRDDF